MNHTKLGEKYLSTPSQHRVEEESEYVLTQITSPACIKAIIKPEIMPPTNMESETQRRSDIDRYHTRYSATGVHYEYILGKTTKKPEDFPLIS